MLLKDILATKGNDILAIEPSATMADAVDKMVAHRCGCLVVCEGESSPSETFFVPFLASL